MTQKKKRGSDRALRMSSRGEIASAWGFREGSVLDLPPRLTLEGQHLCTRHQLRLGGGVGDRHESHGISSKCLMEYIL